jgi:hypothetical protein
MAGWQSIASRLIYLLISACLAIIRRSSEFLDSQSQTRRPFSALALIACLVLGAVVAPGASFKSLTLGRDASRSVDISLGRSSGSTTFSHARFNKLQSNVSCNKSVRAVTAGLSAAVGLLESRFLFSRSRLPFLAHHLSQGFGRSPPPPPPPPPKV